MKRLILCLVFVGVLAWCSPAPAAEPLKPSARDKCAVCGMFVAKYPDFVTEIIFKDGSHAFFDGAKDMFHYYFNLPKYNASKKKEDMKSIYVTDYYELKPVDGFTAFYVTGSNVAGPMGKELIPFEKEEAAKEFMKDHLGKDLLRFEQVTHELVKSLD